MLCHLENRHELLAKCVHQWLIAQFQPALLKMQLVLMYPGPE